MTAWADRWYPLLPVPEQIALVNAIVPGQSACRFIVCPAGRRSGKTERAKRFLIKQALARPGLYAFAAPTSEQVRRIFWADLLLMIPPAMINGQPNHTRLEMPLQNGSIIQCVSLDQPARIEGPPWAGMVIDEIGNTKPGSWAENIQPSLNTINPLYPDYRAWAWLVGVPEGAGSEYHDLFEYALTGQDPQWQAFTWFSEVILPPDVIAEAKRTLSPRQYRQEYQGSFETAAGRIYEDYGAENTTDLVINPTDPLIWCHDFNFTPLSSAVGIVRKDTVYFLDEIVLESAVASNALQEFVAKFADHENKQVVLDGDPSGRIGEKHGHKSDYLTIEQGLKKAGWTVDRKVKSKAPAIKDRQNAVRAKICSADGTRTLFVNPATAPTVHKGLLTTELKPGSSFQEADSHGQHITTAIGYYVERVWPVNRAITTATPLINLFARG